MMHPAVVDGFGMIWIDLVFFCSWSELTIATLAVWLFVLHRWYSLPQTRNEAVFALP